MASSTRFFLAALSLLATMAWAEPQTAQTDSDTDAKAATVTAPTKFRNIYKARAYGFSITVTHELETTEDGQKLRFFADSMLASIEEISYFTQPDEGMLQPTEYRYQRKGLGRDREAHLQFDWDAMRVTNNVERRPWKMDLEPDVQDRLSFQIQLQRDLIAGKTEFTYTIADGGHLKEYQYEIVEEERLKTPLGEVDTVKIKRSRKDSERVTYAWMAPKYQYLLVRMQQEEGGDTYTIYINEANVDGQKIKKFD